MRKLVKKCLQRDIGLYKMCQYPNMVTGLNIKVFEPLAHWASASPVLLARMQNLLARYISDIQVIKQNDTLEIQIANLKHFHLPNWASGSQVLLAPPHFLLAPGKWAMFNVEPCGYTTSIPA